jgi:Cu(I)/Ag(I) efflux system membrane protein CusA/SilA
MLAVKRGKHGSVTVPGVAEVASIGGFLRQYQVRLNPDELRAFNIPLWTVIEKVRDSANEMGGRLIEFQGAEYMVRGRGYLRSLLIWWPGVCAKTNCGLLKLF